MDKEIPLTVSQNEDGSFDIHWDPAHHLTSLLNDFTEEDFNRLIRDQFNRLESQTE